jgi:hypothetical protein
MNDVEYDEGYLPAAVVYVVANFASKQNWF